MRAIAKVILRLLLIYVFLDLLGALVFNNLTQAIVLQRVSADSDYTWIVYTGSIIVAFLIATGILCLIWGKADNITRFLAGELDDNALTITTSNEELFRVAIRVTGIVLLVISIPSLVGLVPIHYYYALTYSEDGYLQADEISKWVTQGVTLLLGLFLALGSRGILRALRYAWNLGYKDTEETSNIKPPQP